MTIAAVVGQGSKVKLHKTETLSSGPSSTVIIPAWLPLARMYYIRTPHRLLWRLPFLRPFPVRICTFQVPIAIRPVHAVIGRLKRQQTQTHSRRDTTRHDGWRLCVTQSRAVSKRPFATLDTRSNGIGPSQDLALPFGFVPSAPWYGKQRRDIGRDVHPNFKPPSATDTHLLSRSSAVSH